MNTDDFLQDIQTSLSKWKPQTVQEKALWSGMMLTFIQYKMDVLGSDSLFKEEKTMMLSLAFFKDSMDDEDYPHETILDQFKELSEQMDEQQINKMFEFSYGDQEQKTEGHLC